MTIQKQKRKNEEQSSFISMIFHGLWIMLREAVKGSAWLLKKMMQGMGWLIQQTWKAMRWIIIHLWLMAFWILKKPWQLLRRIFYGRIPNFENAQQEEAFWRIKRRFGRRRFFLTHSFVFIVGMGMIWFNWLEMMRLAELYPSFTVGTGSYILGSLFWTLLLLFHFLRLRIGDAEDEALGNAMQLGVQEQVSSKRKRTAVEWERMQQRLGDEAYEDDAAKYHFQEEEARLRQMNS